MRFYAAVIDRNIKCIQDELNNTKLSFVKIGYYLKQARDTFDWKNVEYKDIWEYAQQNFNLSKSSASRFMSLNDQFSVDGNSMELLEEYNEYSSSVLTEMLGLSPEERKEVQPTATVKDVRQKKAELHPESGRKKKEDHPADGIPGQMSTDDIPQIQPQKKDATIEDIDEFISVLGNILIEYFFNDIYFENELLDYDSAGSLYDQPLTNAIKQISINKIIKYKNYNISKQAATTFSISRNENGIATCADIDINRIANWLKFNEAVKKYKSKKSVATSEQKVPPVEEIDWIAGYCKMDVTMEERELARYNVECYKEWFFKKRVHIGYTSDQYYGKGMSNKSDKNEITFRLNKKGVLTLSWEDLFEKVYKAIMLGVEEWNLHSSKEDIEQIKQLKKEFEQSRKNELPFSELPSLTNNAKRTEFVDGYKEWPVLTENIITGETVYCYPLENGTVLAVKCKVRHDYTNKLSHHSEEFFLLNVEVGYGVNNKNNFKIADGMTFYDCACNKSALIDFIKEYQKGSVK